MRLGPKSTIGLGAPGALRPHTPRKGGGWSPARLGSSLIAWWNADRADLITTSGSQVTSWLDIKAGYNMVQGVSAARPLYAADSFGGAPGITFDGTDDEMSCADAALVAALPIGSAPGELWALLDQTRDPSSATQEYFVTYGSAANTARRLGRTVIAGVNRLFCLVGDGVQSGGNSQFSVAGNFTGRHLVRLKVEPTQSTAQIDETQGTPSALVPGSNALRLRFGAVAHTAAGFGKGVMREVVVTGPLTTEQQAQLETYLNSRRML